MRATPRTALLVLAVLMVAGCNMRPIAGEPGHGHGRYAGVGIYQPAEPWTRIVAAQQAKETPAAKTIDDQAIIVMVDSTTGEVRSCGDLSGYCIGMNPWKTSLLGSQSAPVNLTEHVAPPSKADATAAVELSVAPVTKARPRRSKVAQTREDQ